MPKTIIFDMGGIILDIYPQKTIKAFSDSLQLTEDAVTAFWKSDDFMNILAPYERGHMKYPEFLNGIKQHFAADIDNSTLHDAWSQIIGHIPQLRLTKLKELANNGYKLLLFSNTCPEHVEIIFDKYPELPRHFEKTYLSYEMGSRKPDLESFQYILDEENLSPSDTAFIDDTLDNIEAAKQLGINAFHLPLNAGIDSEHFKLIETNF